MLCFHGFGCCLVRNLDIIFFVMFVVVSTMMFFFGVFLGVANSHDGGKHNECKHPTPHCRFS